MKLGAALLIAVAAATSFADDDPDLPVVTGRVADDAPGDVRLTLTRRVARWDGQWETANFHRTLLVHPGAAFRFSELPPCPYELVVEGDGVERESRVLDVYEDVAGIDVHPRRPTPVVAATVSGKVSLGFDGAATDCDVSVAGGGVDASSAVASDGSFALGGLQAGAGWVTLTYSKGGALSALSENRVHYFRRLPCTLRPGENRLDLRLDADEDARLVLRPRDAGDEIDGFLTDLAPVPDGPWRERVRVKSGADGKLSASRWVRGGIDSCDFERVGSDFALRSMARGPHRIRVEADGYETIERAFDVAGPTRVDVALTPRPGEYVQPRVDGSLWFVEERGADGTWTPVLSWDHRVTFGGEGPAPEPWIFLAPGRHVLRAVKAGAPPSAPVEVRADEKRTRRPLAFEFPKGARLDGSLVTAQSVKDTKVLGGFEVHCFRLVGERWEPLRAQQTDAGDAFVILGLAPGRHRLAFDAEGRHVLAEFDMGADDVQREFTFRCR